MRRNICDITRDTAISADFGKWRVIRWWKFAVAGSRRVGFEWVGDTAKDIFFRLGGIMALALALVEGGVLCFLWARRRSDAWVGERIRGVPSLGNLAHRSSSSRARELRRGRAVGKWNFGVG
jgi:hypothetical protein